MTNQAQAIREFIEAGVIARIDETLDYFRDEFSANESPQVWDCPVSVHSGGVTPNDLLKIRASRLDLSDLLDVMREMAEALDNIRLATQRDKGNYALYVVAKEAFTRARPYLGGE